MQSEIKLKNREDIQKKFLLIDGSVPARTSGRKAEHRETHCLRIYLTHPPATDLLSFPLTVEKTESPDFLIRNSEGFIIGLEVTDASIEEDQQLMTQLEKEPHGTIIEHAFIDGKYQGRLVKPQEVLLAEGMIGDSVEKEWVGIVLNSISLLSRYKLSNCSWLRFSLS